MGFIEETGAAQLLRDARITPIYEGTTGIQANDLIGRKLARDGGRAAAAVIEEMRALNGALSKTSSLPGAAALFAAADRCARARGALRRGELLHRPAQRFGRRRSAAEAFRHGGRRLELLRSALIAEARLGARRELGRCGSAAALPAAFYRAKIETARFYRITCCRRPRAGACHRPGRSRRARGGGAVEPAAMDRRYPHRIVCLTEEPTEVLYALGEQERIVGISGFTVRPARARREKPRVSAFTSAKVDRILALEPDLVVGFSDIQADIAQALIKAGVEVWISNHRSVDGILGYVQAARRAGRGRRAGGALCARARAAGRIGASQGAIIRAPAARVFRGMGRAPDHRHPLGQRAHRHRRRRRCVSRARRVRARQRIASWATPARCRAGPRTSFSAPGAASAFVRIAWRHAPGGIKCPRCATASCTRSNRP